MVIDMDIFATATVPVIVGICAIVGYCIKNMIHNERIHDFIPTIMCLLGLFLALVNMAIQAAPFTLEIVFGGMASGLASTGMYEMVTHWAERTHGAHEAE